MDRLRAKIARWADEWKLALRGLWFAFRSWRFVLSSVVIFILFGTLLGMLALPSSWQYLTNLPLARKLPYLGEVFLSIFQYPSTILIAILQAFIIGLILLVWWKHRRARKQAESTSGAHLSKAGIITGLAVLAGGCPSCGTSLLAPILGAIFSGSSAAVGNTISWILTLLAILLALFSFKKVGLEAYVIIVSEKRSIRKNGRKDNKK